MKILIFILASISSYSVNAEIVDACSGEKSSNIEIIKIEPPRYPNIPYYDPVEGYVKLNIFVNRSGIVEKVLVVESKPKRVFEKSAIKAIKKSLFSTSSNVSLRCGIFKYEFKLE